MLPCDPPMPPAAVLRQPGAVLWCCSAMNFNMALNRAPNELLTFPICIAQLMRIQCPGSVESVFANQATPCTYRVSAFGLCAH